MRFYPVLRNQVIHIWRDAIGLPGKSIPANNIYNLIHRILCREYGLFSLGKGHYDEDNIVKFFLEADAEHALDVIELTMQVIDNQVRTAGYRATTGAKISADEAVAELNARFLEHGIGYQFLSGELVRKDSEYLHQEVIKPTLALLQDKRYTGAQDEFLKAHEHYRHGNTKECLNECLKAMESTLKTICKSKGWTFQETDTAKTLLDVCFQNNLVPSYLQTQYAALRSTLESGAPTLRNKLGGHGQGAEKIEVPLYYAAYMLHLTGSTIHFLIEAEKHP